MNYEDCRGPALQRPHGQQRLRVGAYGTTLGFTVSNGQVDASTVLLSSLQGPFIYGEGAQAALCPR